MIATSPGTRLRPSLIDPLSDSGWDRFVNNHPAGTVFHTAAWARVLCHTYQYEPRYHVLLDENGAIAAALPTMFIASRLTGRRMVSLPFCDHFRPLINGPEEGRLLLESLLADAEESRCRWVEIRGWTDHASPPDPLVSARGYVRHVVDLRGGSEAVFRGASENARRSVRKAERGGMTVRLGESPRDVEAFYALNLKLRRRHSMLPQPRGFFTEIYRQLVEPGKGFILLAERDGESVAALLCLRHNDVTIDKYAVSDSALWHLGGPHFVMWKSLALEAERGVGWYDMGRSDASAEGLHRFKEQWGAERVDAPYLYFPSPAGQNVADPRGIKKSLLEAFTRVSPDALFVRAGALAYRHVG